ncbi:MAG: hypothetical protein HYW77_00355 [Parcubacteria group bacterium]|nr:hypothetical protein [Parcubacteria group bacterium]
MILVIVVSDILDGVLFRMSNFRSNVRLTKLRRIFDIVGDRIAIDGVMITLIFYTQLPSHYYFIELIREIILIVVVIWSYMIHNPLKEPNLPSRLSAFCAGGVAIAWLNSFLFLSNLFLVGLVVLGVWGIFIYYKTIKLGSILVTSNTYPFS